ATAPAKWVPIRPCGLVNINALRNEGKGTRLAVIADDFAGWERLKGRKRDGKALPDPVLVDLTAERNRDLMPDPYPSGAGGTGFGTRCATELLRANPGVLMTPTRIDPTTPYMLQTVAQAINGQTVATLCLEQRLEELREDRVRLDRRHNELLKERERAFGVSV